MLIVNRAAIEAVDALLREVMSNSNVPFGGKKIFDVGDFR